MGRLRGDRGSGLVLKITSLGRFLIRPATACSPRSRPRDPVVDYARTVDVGPKIHYSPVRYRIVVATGLLIAASALAYGATQGEAIAIAGGLVGLLFVGLFARAVQDKLRAGALALARKGDFLVGGEVDPPLPIAETTFEITSDYEGSWVVVLRSPDASIRLGAGGWKVEGERFVTKAVAERVLLGLGLTRRT